MIAANPYIADDNLVTKKFAGIELNTLILKAVMMVCLENNPS